MVLLMGIVMAASSSFILRKKKVPGIKDDLTRSLKGAAKQVPAQSPADSDPSTLVWTWVGRIGTMLAMVGFIVLVKALQ